MDRNNKMGTEKITRLLLQFSLPAIVGMLVNALYNIVDRIFIGNSAELGTLGLAGLTISFPIMMIMMALAVLFGIGGATLFSIRLGEGKPEEAERVLGLTSLLLILSALTLTVVGNIYLESLLKAFGASEAVLPHAMEYMRIILLGAVFQGISMGGNNFIRADGSPKIAMLTMFLGAGFNILFDPLLIYVFGWGMAGAAIATVGGWVLTSIWVGFYFYGSKSKSAAKFKPENARFDPALALRITLTGVPAFTMQVSNSVLNVVLNKSLAFYGGDIAVSGMGIINAIQTIMIMPLIGINQGTSPIVGFNFGARQYDRVKEAIKWAIVGASTVTVAGYVLIKAVPELLITMFNREPDLIAFASRGLSIWFYFLPVVGFQVVGANYFQAVGKVRPAILLTLTRRVLILVPAIIILAQRYGTDGILAASPLADILAAAITGIWLSLELRQLGKEGQPGFGLEGSGQKA
ncbi:MAG TPA: MATE family efflux transporter [bacterium]|nr:MATE family efflux transporter [bacterium]